MIRSLKRPSPKLVAPEFCCPVRCDDLTIGYEHIRSRGAHGITVNNVYERLVEADREIWLGKDGSGLIKTTPIRWSFFLDEQRARWEAAGHPANVESSQPSYFPFGPGGLSNSHARLSKLPTDPGELAASLEATRRLSLFSIADLMGEALVPEQLRQSLYQVAVSLPGAEQVKSSRDELGRTGIGVARVETMLRQRPGWRIELVFEKGTLEFLGSRQVLVHDEPSLAPAGALVGWTSYLSREIVDELPKEAPAPVPRR